MRTSEITDTVEILQKFIKQNCQPWLEQTNNGQLVVYRGALVRHSERTKQVAPGIYPDEAAIQPIRKRRAASGYTEFRAISNTLMKSLNTTARRYNSVSVSSNKEMAGLFGDTYVFMPIGEFYYTWSTVILDWGSFMTNIAHPGDTSMQELIRKNIREKKPHIMAELKNSIKFDDGSLQQAINSGHEIAINAHSGLYIRPDLYESVKSEL